jgi:transcriptional regulator with XRE-family HTH domain
MTPAEQLAKSKKIRAATKQGDSSRWKCNIKERREALGLSLADIAKYFGNSSYRQGQIESGTYGPSLERLRAFEDFFGCSHRELWEPITDDSTTTTTQD